MSIKFIDIDQLNYKKVIELTPGKEGLEHVAPNHETLLEAMFDHELHFVKAIQLTDENDKSFFIGMFSAYPCDDELNRLWISRFMIDEKHQGKGYGKKAFKLLMEYLGKTFEFDRIELSTSNPISVNLYKQFGFKFLKNDRAKDFYKQWQEYMMVYINCFRS